MPYLRFLCVPAGWNRLVMTEVLCKPARAVRNLRNSIVRPCGSGTDPYAKRNWRLILTPSISTILKLVIEPQVFGNRPTRDESDPQSGFHGGFDGFG